MTVLRAPFSGNLPGPDAGLSRSLSAVVILRFPVCSKLSPVIRCHRWKATVFLCTRSFRRSEPHDHRKKAFKSP